MVKCYWSRCVINGESVGWDGVAGVSRSIAPCLRNGVRLPAHTPLIPASTVEMLGLHPSLRAGRKGRTRVAGNGGGKRSHDGLSETDVN